MAKRHKPNKPKRNKRQRPKKVHRKKGPRLKAVFVEEIEFYMIKVAKEVQKMPKPDLGKASMAELTFRAVAGETLELAEQGRLRDEIDKTLIQLPILLAQPPFDAAKTIFREFEWRLVGHVVDAVMQQTDEQGRTRYVAVGEDDDGEVLWSHNPEFEEPQPQERSK